MSGSTAAYQHPSITMADVEMTDAPKVKSKAAGGDSDGKKRFEVKKVCYVTKPMHRPQRC